MNGPLKDSVDYETSSLVTFARLCLIPPTANLVLTCVIIGRFRDGKVTRYLSELVKSSL
jgi:hypothetical protein